MIFNSRNNKDDISQNILDKFNKIHPNLKFTLEIETNTQTNTHTNKHTHK